MSDWVQWSEIIRNIGLVVGGFIGLWIAAWRGWAASHQARASRDQAVIGRRAHVTELFNAAVEQLGHERLEIRLGAILTLKRMSVDFPDFSDAVFELLSTYVRERSRDVEGEQPTADIREIMRFLRETLIQVDR
jgi:hypothetical protein